MGVSSEQLRKEMQSAFASDDAVPKTALGGSATLTGPQSSEDDAYAARVEALFQKRENNLSDEQLAAAFAGQENIRGPGLGASSRAWMSGLGDTQEERNAVFRRLHPEGELLEVPDTDIVLFRTAGGENFRKIDPGMAESFNQDFLRELGADIADFTGDLPEIAGEAAAQVLFRGKAPPGAGRAAVSAATRPLRNTLFRLALGGSLGEAGQQVTQTAIGTQRETLGEQGFRTAASGSYSIIGGTFAAGLGGVFNVVKRRSGIVSGLREGATEGMRAAERLGVPPLPVTVLTDQPIIQRIGRQAAAVLPVIRRYISTIDKEVLEATKALVDRPARDKFITRSLEAFNNSARQIQDMAQKAVRFRKLHPRTQGLGIQDTISSWWKASGQSVDRVYAAARSIEEPAFVLDEALAHAKKLDEGVFTPLLPKTKTVKTGMLDELGHPITKDVTEVGTRRLDLLSPDVQKQVKNLLEIDPSLPDVARSTGEAISRTDRIRAIIKRLSDESFPPGGGKLNESNLQARSLGATLKKVLKNPANENPEFLAAWAKADKMASARFKTREALAVVDAVNTQTPSQLVDNLVVNRSASIDNLIAIRKATDQKTFQEIRTAFQATLLRNPGKIDEVMDGFQPQVLSMLMPSAERKAMRFAAKSYQELLSTNIQKVARRQTEVGAFVREMFSTESTASIQALNNLVLAQPQAFASPFGKTVRAGVMDEIIRRSTKANKEGVERINGKLLNEVMQEFDAKGLLKLVLPSDKAVLKDTGAVQVLLDAAAEDVGASMLGASTAKGVTQLSLSALGDLLHLFTTSEILISPWFTRLIAGSGKGIQKSNTQVLQILGGMTAALATDVQGSETDNVDVGKLRELVSTISPQAGATP